MKIFLLVSDFRHEFKNLLDGFETKFPFELFVRQRFDDGQYRSVKKALGSRSLLQKNEKRETFLTLTRHDRRHALQESYHLYFVCVCIIMICIPLS